MPRNTISAAFQQASVWDEEISRNVQRLEECMYKLGDSITSASRTKSSYVKQLTDKIQILKRQVFRLRRENDRLEIKLECERDKTREVVVEREEWKKLALHLQRKYETNEVPSAPEAEVKEEAVSDDD